MVVFHVECWIQAGGSEYLLSLELCRVGAMELVLHRPSLCDADVEMS
jgi:hypothetical protein